MNYSNGKIYKICNTINDDVYVGSTTQSLSKRFSRHKESSKQSTKCNYKLYQTMNEIGPNNFLLN